MTYRSNSNPDIEQYKKQDMNGQMTPKVVSFSRKEFEQDLYARSSGLGYEGPLVKKMQKPEKEDLQMEVEGED